jgi:ribulose-phosphate 3-epimerase
MSRWRRNPPAAWRRSGVSGGDCALAGYLILLAWLKSSPASGKVRGLTVSQPVSRQEVWIMPDYKIAPSILSADFARLGEEVDNVIKAGADIVHFDVMDNHYVPNLTIGPLVCAALRKHGVTAEIDVHLMVKPVDRIIPDFAQAGASYITFHPEASEHIDRSLQVIKGEGCKAGLVFNPATPLDYLTYVIDKVDMVLLMSVNPGFGGQSFITTALDKLREARKIIDASGRNIRLEIDGGVKVDNIREIAAAGADTFVAGSAIFGASRESDPNRYDTVIKAMRDELAKV